MDERDRQFFQPLKHRSTSPLQIHIQTWRWLPPWGTWKWIIAIFILAWIPRLLWALAEHPLPFSDMEDYYLCAVNLLKGKYLAQEEDFLAYRAPLYPLFIASCLKLFSQPMLGLRIVQSILGAGSAVMVYFLFRYLLRSYEIEKANGLLQHKHLIPFLAALSYSWLGSQIFFTGVLMTESLFVFLLLLWINLGIRCHPQGSYFLLCIFSLLTGIMSLLRPLAMFFLPIVVFKVLQSVPRNQWMKRLPLPMLAWILPIVPWTLRNVLVLGTFVFITTNSGVNFFLGHNPMFSYYDRGAKETVREEFRRNYGIDEVREDRYLFNKALEYLHQHPESLITHSLWKLYFLYVLEKEPWPWEEYGEGLRFAWGIQWPILMWNPFLLLMALAGITYAYILRMRHGILLSILLLYTLACLVFFARTRFRVPIEPLLMIYVWLGLVSLVDRIIWGYRSIRKGKNAL